MGPKRSQWIRYVLKIGSEISLKWVRNVLGRNVPYSPVNTGNYKPKIMNLAGKAVKMVAETILCPTPSSVIFEQKYRESTDDCLYSFIPWCISLSIFNVFTFRCLESSIKFVILTYWRPLDQRHIDWLRPDMTEKLLTGTLSLNTNKQTSTVASSCCMVRYPIFGAIQISMQRFHLVSHCVEILNITFKTC